MTPDETTVFDLLQEWLPEICGEPTLSDFMDYVYNKNVNKAIPREVVKRIWDIYT